MQSPFLVGKNVYLRPHVESDLPRWTEWFNDAEVTRYITHGYVPNTIELQRQRFESQGGNPSSLFLAIVAKSPEQLVGTLSLTSIQLIHRNAEISILLGERSSWGKGFAKEALSLLIEHAFLKLNLHKLFAGAIECNVTSVKLFEGLGFSREATLKEHFFHEGKFHSGIRFSLFQDQWKQRQTKVLS